MGQDISRMDREIDQAVRNSVAHCKRSFLDFLDLQKAQFPEHRELFAFLAKRVHNDVSVIEHQIMAALRIARQGGEIPPFGRTTDERERAPVRAR